LAPSWKNLYGYLWKNPLMPPPGKILPTHMHTSIPGFSGRPPKAVNRKIDTLGK